MRHSMWIVKSRHREHEDLLAIQNAATRRLNVAADVTQAILDTVAPRTPKHRAQSAHEMKEAEEEGPGSSPTPPTRGNSNA